MNRYPEEVLGPEDDDGTMPNNVADLEAIVVGERIVSVETEGSTTLLTLSSGKVVKLVDTDDCCAYTDMQEFLLEPGAVDHAILGVGTTENYTVWHIYADYGDVLTLQVGWSPGNPFYYGYGFDIVVVEPDFVPVQDDELKQVLDSIRKAQE